MHKELKKEFELILTHLNGLLSRRFNVSVEFIKNQIECLLNNNLNEQSKNEIFERISKHLDVPTRRCDDWRMEIIRQKVEHLRELDYD